MNILYNSLKSGGTKDHFRQKKVPGTTPYWNTSVSPFVVVICTPVKSAVWQIVFYIVNALPHLMNN
jgi:hypothetical protein